MIYELIYIVICLAMAWVNFKVIEANLRVYHAINGIIHLACWVAVFIITKSWFPVVLLPFIGRLFFDTALSVMRNLPIGYVSQNPNAIADKLEIKLFGNNGITPKIIYLVVVVVVNVVVMVK